MTEADKTEPKAAEVWRRQKLANIAFLQRTANLLTGYSGSAPKPSQLGGRQLLGT